MNPHHSSNQNPASTSAVQQVNPVINQQMLNGNVGGLFPNNMPVVGPPCFMNFPGQPFALPNITGQFPNGIGGFIPQQNFNPFPVNQFNLAQQQQGQFGAYQQNVGVPSEQALVQNTIQNIYQLLQLQNSNFTQCPPGSFPMFQNQFVNVMNPQNPGFPVNQQFGISSANGSVQHANHGPPNMGQQIQGNPFVASGSVQAQQPQNLNASLINFQFPQGMGPQNHNCMTNQMFGMANSNDLMQNVDQGPPGFEDNKTNAPTNVNGGLAESQSKNFTGYKTNDASHKGSKSYKHVEQKFGIYKGNMGKDSDRILAVGTASRNSTDFEKKVPSLNYTKQEVKEWCEARKKNYPTNETILKKHKKEQTLSDVTNLEAIKRRQQLKEILAKQAELGCEVADIPPSYFSGLEKQNPIEKSYERQHKYKRGKFHNKRGTSFQDGDYITKRARPRHQKTNHQPNPNKREPSLLQKLLTRDIKRDKTHLLQVLRLFAVVDDIFCLFQGHVENVAPLKQQYGLNKTANEVSIVIEAYRTLRDRGPYPADQVMRDLQGKFAFVLYDSTTKSTFIAADADGSVPFFWGADSEGNLVLSDDVETVKKGCGKSFAPFPKGCFFTTSGGLRSFEHPLNELKAVPRVDSSGDVCGANFKVDSDTKKESGMPRVGSAANWSQHY